MSPPDDHTHPGTISRTEWAFLVSAAAMLLGSCWLLGGREPWSQWTLLVFGSALFLNGILLYRERLYAGRIGIPEWRGFRLSAAFLIGFVAFVAIQSLNIAYRPILQQNHCELVSIPHVEWLPSSIGGPFDGRAHTVIRLDNAARYLLLFSGPALGALGLIIGLQARSTLHRVVTLFLIHALITSIVSIAHQISGSDHVLWISRDPLMFMGAPFFHYKNQNALYQFLLFSTVLLWVRTNHVQRPRFSAVAVLITLSGVMVIRSRAGLIFAMLLFGLWIWSMRAEIWQRVRPRRFRTVALGTIAAGLLGSVFWSTGGPQTLERMQSLRPSVELIMHGDTYRRLLHEISLEMFNDRPWFGSGAGSYLYNFASFEHRVPEMASNRPNFSYYRLTKHADGDWYEFLTEYGLVGTLLFLLIWVPHGTLWITSLSRHAPALYPAAAVGLALYHGMIDQSFRHGGLFFLLLATAILASKRTLLGTADAKA